MSDDIDITLERFFKLLDHTETSDYTGNEFHPIQISSCRTFMGEEMKEVLKTMREYLRDNAYED